MSYLDKLSRWPAHRFYWAICYGDDLKGRGRVPPPVLEQLAIQWRVHAEQVFAIMTPILDRRGRPKSGVVACAANRSDLEVHARRTHTLCPESIPPALGVRADPADLNFSIGRYAPDPMVTFFWTERIPMMAEITGVAPDIALFPLDPITPTPTPPAVFLRRSYSRDQNRPGDPPPCPPNGTNRRT